MHVIVIVNGTRAFLTSAPLCEPGTIDGPNPRHETRARQKIEKLLSCPPSPKVDTSNVSNQPTGGYQLCPATGLLFGEVLLLRFVASVSSVAVAVSAVSGRAVLIRALLPRHKVGTAISKVRPFGSEFLTGCLQSAICDL